MHHPVNTSSQLRSVLRALRQSRKLNQSEVGHLLGVNQKRVARIESDPGVTSFDQIARLVMALGGRVLIESRDEESIATADPTGKPRQRKKTAPQAGW